MKTELNKLYLNNESLILSARIEHVWNETLTYRGWGDFCESTTQFNDISYNYTKDAPLECVLFGEFLWRILFSYFGGDGISIGKAPLSTVTRRSELWEK